MGIDSPKTGPADSPTDTGARGSSGDTVPQTDEGTPAGDAARAERSRAQIEERQVTPDLEAISAETEGRLLGLENNIKSQESLERKITQSDKEPTDVLRYTMAFSHDHIADGATAAMASLRADDYKIVSVENKWLDPTPGEYRGIHATVESPTGYKFELQFHTPESFAVKEAGTHDLYEIARDKDQSPEDRAEAQLAGRLYSSTLLIPPPGIERIASVS